MTQNSKRRLVCTSFLCGSLMCAAVPAAAPSNVSAMPEVAGGPAGSRGGEGSDVRRSVVNYETPHVRLVREDGKSVDLAAELDDGRPVVMNFVYTSCTTICPMSSQTFQRFQDAMGAAGDRVHLVSISIDPEQDTPKRLRDYAAQFHAGRGWNHYSGTMAASVAVQRAFDAYRGDKMSHIPLTLVRAAPGLPWVRFDGFASSDDLIAERRGWAGSAALVAR